MPKVHYEAKVVEAVSIEESSGPHLDSMEGLVLVLIHNTTGADGGGIETLRTAKFCRIFCTTAWAITTDVVLGLLSHERLLNFIEVREKGLHPCVRRLIENVNAGDFLTLKIVTIYLLRGKVLCILAIRLDLPLTSSKVVGGLHGGVFLGCWGTRVVDSARFLHSKCLRYHSRSLLRAYHSDVDSAGGD